MEAKHLPAATTTHEPDSSVNQAEPAGEQEDYIDLGQYWMALKRRWFSAVLVFASTIGLAAAYSFQQEPIYQSDSKLMIEQDSGSSSSQQLPIEGNIVGQGGNPIPNHIEIIQSSPILQQVIKNLDLKNDEGKPLEPEDLREKLTVSNLEETDILELKYDSPDREKAQNILNELMAVYQQHNVEENTSQAEAKRQFIEKQLETTKQDLQQKEQQLRAFKEQHNVIALSEEAAETVKSLSGLEQQLIQAQADLNDAKTRIKELSAQLGLPREQGMAAAALTQSEGVQSVLEQYQKVEQELAIQQSRYKPEHPQIQRLKERQASLESLLEQRVNTVVQEELPADPTSGELNLQLSELKVGMVEDLAQAQVNYQAQKSRVERFKEEKQQYQQRKANLPQLEQQKRALERQIQVLQTTYEALSERLQQVRIAENKKQSKIRIVENGSLPENPISPKIKLNLALGGILGAMLGIATALMLDARDRTLKTVQEIKNQLNYTLLGSIPSFGKEASALPLRDKPRSSVSESFRMLQANLKFSQVDEQLQVIVVSSSVPGEGKSTVSANLGMALAEMGKKVLIVDSDLRRPSQHQMWEEPNASGLSNVLVEPDQLSGAIQELDTNLYLLTAGAPPPNPIALLDSQRMQDLLEQFRQEYDYILLDSPPVAVAADSAMLGNMAQGTLLVVRPNVVDQTSLTATKEMLQRSGQPLLGMVINGVNPKDEPDSYYYYYAQDYYAGDSEENGKTPKKALFGKSKSKAESLANSKQL